MEEVQGRIKSGREFLLEEGLTEPLKNDSCDEALRKRFVELLEVAEQLNKEREPLQKALDDVIIVICAGGKEPEDGRYRPYLTDHFLRKLKKAAGH